jgi:hypothetical protein
MGGKAPEDEEAPPRKETPQAAQDDAGEPVEEQVEKPAAEELEEIPTEPSEPVEAEEDEVEFEAEDGKPGRAKLSEIVEGYLRSLKPAATFDDKAIRAQIKAELDRDHAAKSREITEAQAKWLEKAELWSKWNGEPRPPNPDMLDPNHQSYDPDRYHRARAMYERSLASWNQVQGDIKKVRDDAGRDQAASVERFKTEERAKLARAWPELFAPETSVKTMADLMATAKEYDIEPEELGNMLDHRAFRVLRDAAAYRAMKSAKGAEGVKKKAKPKLVKAAARTADAGSKGGKMSSETREYLDARKRVAKTGKINTPSEALAFFGDAFSTKK